MIPALPEKDGSPAEATKAGPPPAPLEPASEAKLTDRYEQDVLDFVSARLEAGWDEERIVEELREHDFGKEESRRLVRALDTDRSAPAAPRTNRLRPGGRVSEEEQLDALVEAEIAAGNREMGFGAMWFVGGLLLTAVTFAAGGGAGGILFWGAIIWGVIDFFRGANRVSAAKNLRNQL